MAALLKLARGAPPPLSEARAKLADTIADRKAAEDRLRGIQAALDGENGKVSWKALWAAEADVTAAKDGLAAVQTAAADYLLRDALGTAEGPAPDLEAARAAVTAAEDRVAAIRAARETLGRELQPAKEKVEMCGYDVESAVSAVLRDEMQQAITDSLEEIEALQRRYVAKQLALDTLIAESETRTLGAGVGARLTEIAGRAQRPLYDWRLAHLRGETDPSPSRSALRAAIEALKADPTAKLPETI